MSKQEDTQRKVISIRKIEAVQASLSAFDFEGQQYLPKAVAQAVLVAVLETIPILATQMIVDVDTIKQQRRYQNGYAKKSQTT